MTDDSCTKLAAAFQEPPEDLPCVDITTDCHKPSSGQDRVVRKEGCLLELSGPRIGDRDPLTPVLKG